MTKQNIPKNAVFLFFLVVFIAGCSQSLEKKAVAENVAEETEAGVTDTGILSVKSIPSSAQVYVDGELKGNSPFTVYNLTVGHHVVLLKKAGYADFENRVVIKVGRTEEIEPTLTPLTPINRTVEESKSMPEKAPENASLLSPKLNIVNISKSFVMYYDFNKELFTDITTANPDIFSSNYGAYIYFTAMNPSRMRIANKQIKDIKKEDCINADDTIANLYSRQTLCVKTTEGLFAAIGGSWQDKPTELEWTLFS